MSSLPEFRKLIDLASLQAIFPDLSDKKNILTGGVFDLLKPFHIDLFEFAKSCGDILVVAVEEEGRYTPLEERLEILNEIEDIDYLMVFKGISLQKIPQNLFSEIIINEEFALSRIRSDFSGKIKKFSVK